jgi:hypothetical protein
MSTINEEIDLNLLIQGIEKFPSDLPQESAEFLRQAIANLHHQTPNSKRDLVLLVTSDPHLDQLCRKSLRSQMQGYNSQERAKSLDLSLHQPLSAELTNALNRLTDLVNHLIHDRETKALSQAQTQILKTLEKSHLTPDDFIYTLTIPRSQTEHVLHQLWQKGYIDKLTASVAYILFPKLRSPQYRAHLPAPDTFLTLTAKGYFHLYPLLKRNDRPASA